MSGNITLITSEAEVLYSNLETLSEDIKKNMGDIEDIMGKLPECFEGEVATSVTNKYSEYQDCFNIVDEAFKSYVSDFKNLVTNFESQDQATSANEVTINNKGGDLVNVKY